MSVRKRSLSIIACLLMIGLSATPRPTLAQEAPVAQTPTLAQALRKMADETIAHCKSTDAKSVGVLKFLVVKGGDDFSDSVGTINSALARRLEVALVLANDAKNPVTLIDDASATAQTIAGATHLSADGRAKLLGGNYPAMWGGKKLSPDLLVSGIVSVSNDLSTLTLSLVGFDRESKDLFSVGTDHVAAMRAGLLSEVGESYSTRGAFDGGKLQTKSGANLASSSPSSNLPSNLPSDLPPGEPGANPDQKVLTAAKSVREQGGTHPLVLADAPVRLQVRYDGAIVPFEFTGGVAKLREPRAGQRVEMTLTKDATDARYAVVVKVNGQNVLSKQTLPDHQCRKWVLSKPGMQVPIRGYQVTNDEIEAFRVLDQTESANRAIDYGKEVGTISITVFPEGKPPTFQLDEDKHEAELVEKSQLPKKPSSTFGALKAKLLADANRGLIAEGNREAGSIRVIKFFSDPTPVMTATATYYTP